MNTLFLVLSTFNSTGGIQRVCRCICKALSGNPSGFKMISLYDEGPCTEYLSQKQFMGFGSVKWFRKLRFILAATIEGRRSQIVVLGHIHLIPAAMFVKFLNPRCHVVMLAHGTEVWRGIPALVHWFLRKYTHLLSVSNFTAAVLEEKHSLRCRAVIGNCVDPFFQLPAEFNKPTYLMERYGIGPQDSIILTICRINHHEHAKGYDTVIKLMPKLIQYKPELRYMLCGPYCSNEYERLQKLIRASNLQDHITLTGHVPEAELGDHYMLADIFVMPSSKEGFGLVFTEAAACGCIVIALKTGGSTEALLNGNIGRLTDPSNEQQLADVLKHAIENPHNEARKSEIRDTVLTHFGFATYQEKLQRFLYSDIRA